MFRWERVNALRNTLPHEGAVSNIAVNKVRFESDPARVDAPVLDFYLSYWREKRSRNKMPARSQLRPSEIREHIASITLAEGLPGLDDFRFRIVGTKVAQYFLADATGKTIRQLYAAAVKPVIDGIVQLHRAPLERAAPLLIHASTTLVEGLYFTAFDVLYLPLSDSAGNGAFVLGAYSFPDSMDTDQNLPSGLPGAYSAAPPIIAIDLD